MKRYSLLLILFMLVVAAGCGQAVNSEEPPKIVYGQDVCDRCNMIISEEKYAAAYWTEEGEARRFDDIGGMLAFITEESEAVASYWVHDFDTSEWLRAENATYLLDGDLKTPMGFGIAAFADKELAQAMAHDRENVMVHSFADLLAMNIIMPGDHLHDSEEMEHTDGMDEMDHEDEGDGE